MLVRHEPHRSRTAPRAGNFDDGRVDSLGLARANSRISNRSEQADRDRTVVSSAATVQYTHLPSIEIMTTSDAVKNSRKIIIPTAIVVACIFSIPFIYRFVPSLFPREAFFVYLLFLMAFLGFSLLYGLGSCGWMLFAKIKRRRPNTASVVGVALFTSTVVFALLTYGALQLVPRELPPGSDLKKFDSSLWKSESSSDSIGGISAREQMLEDLVVNVLPGKNRSEIETLLGPSTETQYFADTDKDLIYHLGPERNALVNLDTEWLLIWLGQDGKFGRYRI